MLLGQQRAMRYLKPLVLNLLNDESPVVQGTALSRALPLLEAMVSPSNEDQKVRNDYVLNLLMLTTPAK